MTLEETFEVNEIPEGWQNIDADGDGQVWKFKLYWNSPDGTGFSIGSESWGSGYKDGSKPAYTPDNWLITPKITVPNDGKLQFDVASHSPTYNEETYGIFLSESGSAIEDFTVELYKETISEPNRSNKSQSIRAAWLDTRTLDLSAYAGKEIYLAFRHFESNDQMAILLDNIKVWAVNQDAPTVSTYNIYRNGELLASSSELSFTDASPKIGTNTYEIEVKYSDGGLSPKVAIQVVIFDPNGVATIELEAHDVWGDGSGYQVLLDNTATQYGQAIPLGGPLTSNCTIPASLQSSFTHFIPANADISCTPETMVFDGAAKIEVPAGYYDWCVVNPSAGDKIWIAGKGRFNDYPFEGGKHYHILAEKDPESPNGGDHVVITISEVGNTVNPVTNLTGVYDQVARNVKLNWQAPAKREASLHESFDSGIPSSWKLIDADGDGNNWMPGGAPASPGFEGSNSLISFSWLGSSLTPDNWLVSPKFTVPAEGELSYWIGVVNDVFFGDKYGVFISETTDDVAAFTELHSETMQEAGSKASLGNKAMRDINTREVGGWSIRKIDISSYAGKEVYIAFRHYDSEDIFGLILDEVKVSGASVDPEPEELSYNVYCNDALIGNVETLNFTHNNSIPGTYKYEVEVKDGSGALSPKEAVEVQVIADDMEAAPVTNLKGTYDPETKTLKLDWDAPVIKTKVLYEKFEGGIPSNWLNVDADGDGHSWVSVSPEFSGVNPETGQTDLGTDCPTSASYINGTGPLTPDNWLITPKVKIPNDGKLSYWVRGYDPNAFQEHYGVFLSETDTEISSFTKELFSESLIRVDAQRNSSMGQRGSEASDRGHWNFREINLAEYAGKEVYLAFRHYEITDKYWLLLDEVTLSGKAEVADLSWTYSVYHNDNETALAQNLTAETYTHSNPPEGLQSYKVEVNYSNGMVSPKVAVEVNIVNSEPEGMAVIYLKAHDVWGDGTGYQILLDNTATQFGNAIPEVGPLVNGCDVPADLSGKFSHRLPTNADISCTPEHQVVDGEEMTTIPAGIYDYCIVNPEPSINIWIASGNLARQDNYEFKAGNEYHFEALLSGSSDMIVLTIVESTAEISSVAKAYGIEGYIVVDASQAIELSVFDLQGRRTVCKNIDSKTMIPSEAGIYLVKLSSGSKSQSYKVIVK